MLEAQNKSGNIRQQRWTERHGIKTFSNDDDMDLFFLGLRRAAKQAYFLNKRFIPPDFVPNKGNLTGVRV